MDYLVSLLGIRSFRKYFYYKKNYQNIRIKRCEEHIVCKKLFMDDIIRL